MVALRVLYEPRMSISMTDLNALTESCSIEARKLPAAPALLTVRLVSIWSPPKKEGGAGPYMTKSMPPNSLTQRSTASFKLSNFRTSTAPMPITLAPCRAVAIS